MIGEREKEAIKRACERKGRVHAIAVYGSRVAGYAREDSDYDVLLALEGFRERAKYSYERFEGLNLSILMVDEEELVKDAEEAKLGEFVAGRLLNPYLPLMNEEFWRGVEVRLKKRVIMEEFGELADEFGRLSLYMKVPLRYFLFSKLKKRATIYPPALYSYSMTYSREENVETALKGFLEAAKELKGLVELKDEFLMLTERGFSRLRRPAFKRKVELIGRGIRQYVVHGLAGKVGLDVVFKEAYSKVSRNFYEVPEELKEPRASIGLVEGVFTASGDWFSRLKDHLGLKGEVRVEMKPLGSFYSTTYLYRLSSNEGERRLVVKRFLDIRSIKWLLVNIVSRPARGFEILPMVRLGNEYSASIEFRKAEGVGTPKILLVSPKERLMVKEFVEGKPATELVKEGNVAPIAKAMASIHRMGYSIGDTKPENLLLKDGKVYFVDLEQAEKGGDRAWDVAEFLYYSCWFLKDEGSAKALAERFVSAYDYEGSILRRASGERYALPFRSVAEDDMIAAVKKVLRS